MSGTSAKREERPHPAHPPVGPFVPADLNFQADEAGVVWAPIPTTGAPAVGVAVLAGAAVAWSWTRVRAVEVEWLLLELTEPPLAADGFVDVTGVELAGGYVLRLRWADGEVSEVDVEPYLSGEAGTPVRDPAVFAGVAVDPAAGTVVWPGGFDISPAQLRRAGRVVPPSSSDWHSRAL